MSDLVRIRAEAAEAALAVAQEAIASLRAELAECQALCSAQQDTIAALRIEIHLLRRRYGLTPEVAQQLLGLVGV